MAYRFFENAIGSGMQQYPNEMYRDLQQSFITQQYDNTFAREKIQEQDSIGLDSYHDVEAWIGHVIGQTTTFMKNGEDYKQLFFEDINKQFIRGLFYKFNRNYWICDYFDETNGLAKYASVRRCNNVLRVRDSANGGIFEIPCVVDYDMTSPSAQVTSTILTPNNHAIVITQLNEDTKRLFKYNTRFILGGRAFKLMSYQNALVSSDYGEPTVFYLDLYLDELHSGDDIENQLADNGEYNYTIKIDSTDIVAPRGSYGKLEASVLLNGNEVTRPIVWLSKDTSVVRVKDDGSYTIFGYDGAQSSIVAYIDGNESCSASINVSVVENEELSAEVITEPTFNSIKQYQTIDFEVKTIFGGKTYLPKATVSLVEDKIVMNNDYLSLTKGDNGKYSLTCKKFASLPQKIYIQVENEEPMFMQELVLDLKLLSMFG